MRKAKALITGITGFLGYNLTKYLLNYGWDVAGVFRNNGSDEKIKSEFGSRVKLWKIDEQYNMDEIFNAEPYDVVFHLAAVSIVDHKITDIDKMISSNILFGTKMLDYMTKYNCKKLVNIGSSWQNVIANSNEYHPMDLYAATKEAYIDIIKFYTEKMGMNCITLKLFDTYGPNDTRRKILNLLKKQVCSDENVLNVSAGEQEMDFVYIDDVCACIELAARYLLENKMQYCGTYMVSGANKIPLRKVGKMIETITGRKLNVNWGGRPYRKGEVMKTWMAGKTLPGWKPKVSLNEGLKKCFELEEI